MSEMTLVKNIGQLLTMDPDMCRGGNPSERLLGLVTSGAVLLDDGKVVYSGPESQLPATAALEASTIDAKGKVVMPGLVECHTHLVFGGNRANEFQMRALGIGYEAIARQGGGILNTVEATRQASADELFELGMERLDRFLEFGVTTVEIKSGYGLNTETELKILEVIRRLGEEHELGVVPTFLGAHVVAPEFKFRSEAYVDLVCQEMIPEVARRKLALFCDVFCEEGAFTVAQSRRILETGAAYGLLPKIHCEQLTHSGGCALAGQVKAMSADHLDFCNEADARSLSDSGTVATFLPGATFFIGKKRFPNGRMFKDAGARIALSTDFNPGSSHTQNLWLMGTMGSSYMGLTPAECLRAMTVGAATALGLRKKVGQLKAGMQADLLVLKSRDWQDILYLYGTNPVQRVI